MDLIQFAIIIIYALTLVLVMFGISIGRYRKKLAATKSQNFTIVVVYRNENHHLPQLLNSFEKLNYDKNNVEILMVNDGSSATFDFRNYNLPIKKIDNVRYSNSPKKDGISLAVNQAKHEWIVLTDADCVVPENWLQTLNAYISNHQIVEMVCGSVFIYKKQSFIDHFQAWDFTSLQAITLGSFGLQRAFMCNGANMAFTKTIFKAVGGYASNNFVSSGDDVFLLQAVMSLDKEKVGFLCHSDFNVATAALSDWYSLINQRIRWGGKAKYYRSWWGIYLSLMVIIISLLFIWAVISFKYKLLIAKIFIDLVFLKYFSKMTHQHPKYLILSVLLYPFFIFAVLFKSLFTTTNWK